MIDLPWLPSDYLAKIIGTIAGTVMGLAVSSEPDTQRGVGKRVVVSAIFGMLLSDIIGEEFFGWSMIVPNRIIAASCISAAGGWWVAHAAIRLIQARGR